MAALPEDDAPTMSGTPGDRRRSVPDDATAAEALPPAEEGPAGHEEEDRTVQQLARASSPALPPRPSAPAIAASPSPTQETLPSSHEPIEVASEHLEPIEEPDDITATAPRLDSRKMPLAIPGTVEIRAAGDVSEALENDEGEARTEVRSVPRDIPSPLPAPLRPAEELSTRPVHPPPPRPAAGAPPSPPAEEPADEEPDSVTAEAPAPRIASVPDLDPPKRAQPPPDKRSSSAVKSAPRASQAAPAEEPPTRPGVEEPATRPGLADPPPSLTSAAKKDAPLYDADDDESVTTRGPAVDPFESDDSVTTQGPAVAIEDGLPIDEGTDGTTQRVKKLKTRSPADSEVDSITTQAPGNLTNMLRVIAADDPAAAAAIEDEELPENRTAVMANAPIRSVIEEVSAQQARGELPPIRPTGPQINLASKAATAPQLHPTSESGLRVARQGSASGEHASLRAIGVHDARTSGVGPTSRHLETGPHDPRALAATMDAFAPQQPSLHDVDFGKGPRYGLIVGVVAVVSLLVPVTLFIVLNRGEGEVSVPTASTASSDFQRHVDAPRGKHDRNKKADPAAPPSAAASTSAKPPPPRFPFRR
ncbi:MAG: hypothetical protein KF819_15650 [Labilithrix sp.]|nr:hypothetical protein [Labilithrix sp.]